MEKVEGWIFDAYPEPGGMRVWIIEPDGRHRHFLPRRPVADIRRHSVARPHRGDARPDALDLAGEFRRGRKRKGRLGLVLAGDDQRVEEVERRRPHRDHRLAGAR